MDRAEACWHECGSLRETHDARWIDDGQSPDDSFAKNLSHGPIDLDATLGRSS
jgi:hypothetical protein